MANRCHHGFMYERINHFYILLSRSAMLSLQHQSKPASRPAAAARIGGCGRYALACKRSENVVACRIEKNIANSNYATADNIHIRIQYGRNSSHSTTNHSPILLNAYKLIASPSSAARETILPPQFCNISTAHLQQTICILWTTTNCGTRKATLMRFPEV